MKIHWSIADQQLQIAVEHTGRTVEFPKIAIPFLHVNYFMWNVESVKSIKMRFKSLCGM